MRLDTREEARPVSTRWGTIGELATAAFAVSVAAGVLLAVPYDAADPAGSLGRLLLTNPPGVFIRNLHYWASQLCLVLTVWHAIDHLLIRSEARLPTAVWVRTASTLPLVLFLMLSGFLLRGDAESQQALRIVYETLSRVPILGPPAASLLLGHDGRLTVILLQHAAGATIVVWLFTVEHTRRLWPRPSSLTAIALVTSIIAAYLTPGLHDGLDPVTKGPWYFLGLQEALHWTSQPVIVIVALLGSFGCLVAVRWAQTRTARWIRRGLAATLAVYIALCAVGAFARGESWSWRVGWPHESGGVHSGFVFQPAPDVPSPRPSPLPMALNRPEGCLVCHNGVVGLGNAHRPDAVGCASCHGGNVFSLVKAQAHDGLRLIPGNLADASLSCGQAACHPSIVPRLQQSLMTTMSGVVAVDRLVFGEIDAAASMRPTHVSSLGHTPADTHARQLCASCHLGQAKREFGPNREDSRGGGCNACHLTYGADALFALGGYTKARVSGDAVPPRVHPGVTVDIPNTQCFGCHSRSSRISTNYEGWHELHQPPAKALDPNRPGPSLYRTLADGRVFERVLPDVHQQRGMACIDCHGSLEVMGDGTTVARKQEQVRVGCDDCHGKPGSPLRTVPPTQLDPESRKLLALRQWPGPPPTAFGIDRDGRVMVNVIATSQAPAQLISKRTGERRELKMAAAVCVEGGGHARLACSTCHTAWAPHCPTCHTRLDAAGTAYDWQAGQDVKGAWHEDAGAFRAEPPTLGVRADVRAAARGSTQGGVIDTFVPGMILTIDRRGMPAGSAGPTFRRWYARMAPHTTRREVRTCVSCHNDPVALGYGRGQLRYVVESGRGRWTFTPSERLTSADGLPADAWTPFLGARTDLVSSRPDARPFTPEEQRRILRVGACLTCHAGDAPAMRGAVKDFDAVLRRRSPRCAMPAWN